MKANGSRKKKKKKKKKKVLVSNLSTAMSMTVTVERYMGTAKAAKTTRHSAAPKYQLSVS